MLLRRFRAAFVSFCLLFHTCIPSHAAELLISEFMANNESALTDEDGEASDWIEIHNPGSNAVNLLNWVLTDSVNRPDKWIFPATNLPAGGYLIVFASEKNRRLPGAPLHTNFKLSNDGEFLSLGRPGFSPVSSFHPAYPRQFRDVSYGFGMQVSSALVISNGSLARFRVPSSAAHEAGWIEGSFDDASWREGAVPAGFEAGRDPVEDSYIGALLSTSPLVHYRFSETQGLGVQNVGNLGSRADASRVGAVATNQTGPQGTSFGGFESTNKAYRFGGSARVRVPSQPEFNLAQDPFALSFWFFPTSIETPSDLFTYRGAAGSLVVQFAAQGPGTFSIFHNRLLGGGGGIVANAWHHLALSRDSGGILSAYLNGDLVFAIEDPESLSIGTDWLIGAGHNGDPNLPTRGFGGRIDEFSFWSRGLAESEVSDLYLTARTSPSSYAAHIRTDLTGFMHNVNSSVQVRIPFLLENPEEIDHLLLSLQYDDGAVVYLNGREVASLSAPESLSWNSRATARRPDRDAIVPVELDLSDLRGALTAGRNILAIQGLNLDPANPDFLIGVTLEVVKVGSLASSPGFFTTPTPGAPNGRASELPGPIIRSLQHSPALPTDSDDLLITASVSPSFANIASVLLRYRVNYGVTNTLPMFDDGLHGDGGASDGLYGAYVPASASTNGQCIRYKVEALDVAGGTSRWPLFEDRLGSPEYQGTMVQGSPIASPLPVWHWWARAPENARTRNGERVSVFYNGEFFDNVFARERGGFTTSGSQKFDFNRGFRVKMSDEVGRVDEVNLNGNGSDPTYLRPPLAFETYRRAGNAACASFPVLMRLNGRTDRVAVFVEQVDPIFLKRWGFNDQGVLYKFVQRGQITPVFSDSTDGVEKETFRTESPNTDLQQIVDAIKLPTVAQRQAFFFDRFNIPQIINFLACRSITMDADDVRKNFYMYNDREGTGEWSIFPWDKDWTFGVLGDGGDALPHPFFGDPAHSKPDTQSNVLLDRLFNDPVTREMYLRRLRTLSDQMLQAPWTPTTHLDYERRVDLWAGLVSKDVPGALSAVPELKAFFPRRRLELFVSYNVMGTTNAARGLVPEPQPASPVILFGAIESNPSSGNQNEEFLQLINTNKFAVDVSDWSISGGIRHTLTPGTVIPSGGSLFLSPDSKAFRGRGTGPRGGQGLFVQGGYQGQLSGWGEELVLRDHVGRLIQSTQTQPAPSLAQQSLRIVEILFHPLPPPNSLPSPDPFQFIEILNYGTLPVDLAGVKLVDGVSFEFPRHQPHVIAPNQRVVMVHDLVAFRSRYGPAVPVAGVFSGRLDVGGEKLRLEDASGEEIQEVTYNDDWYLMPNGGGFALVAEETKTGTRADWGTRAFWTSGSRQGGTPGEPETPRPHLNVVIDEISVRPPIEDVPVMEIRNLGQAPVDVSGWWLSDDPPPDHEKHRVPTNTVLQAGASTTFLMSFLSAGKRIGFSFDGEGDEAVLVATDSSNALNGYGVEMNTRDTFLGGSLRRWVTSDGREWVVPVPVSTIGKPKGPIRVGPVVISEVHYHPVDLNGGVDNEQDEFIEIRNLSDARVNLFNPMEPSLTWKIRGDVDFDFPTNIYLPAKGVLLVVSFDPRANPQSTAQFHQRLGVTPAARLFGPFRGKLNNDSGSIRLVQPDGSGNVVVDEVSFRDAAPWPELADGFGASLHRRMLDGFGSEPQNWMAASPSPGRQALQGSAPVITQQPVHGEGALGTPIRLSVDAEGSPTLHYQWEFEGKAIPGATNSTLSLLNPTQDAEGMYRALVMNGFGYAYSHPASLRFRSPPVITLHPVSRAALIGGSATFRGGAIGVRPLAYQWRRNGVVIPGVTTTNLVINPVQNSDFGTYEMIVSDQNGVAVSQTAMLVQSTPPVVIQPPLSLGAVLGETVVISVAVDAPPPLTYRWRRGVTSLVTATLDSTASFLTLTNFKASDATNYSVIVTNLAGSVSNAFTLTLLADVDRDGMADEWEVRNGLNAGDPADALLDGDADGRTSREEYLAGTNPKDGSDVLRLDYVGHSRQGYPAFEFKTRPGRTYSIEARSVLGTGRWIRLREHPADENEQVYWFEDDRDGVGEMYLRIVTPRLP